MSKIYMGLFCHGSHDSAVALVDAEGRVLFAAEQERYDRIKHSSRFPEAAIRSAFAETGVGWGDIASVGFAWDPFADWGRISGFLARNAITAPWILLRPKQNTESRISKWRGMRKIPHELRRMGWRGRAFKNWNHHLCHAAATFFASGFPDAVCLTIDGNGEFASTCIHERTADRFRSLFRVDYPHSLGHFYATLTQYLGFKPLNDEYKVMGLAAFRRANYDPALKEKFRRILVPCARQVFRLNLQYFQFFRGQDRMWSAAMEELLGSARIPGSPIEPRHEEIAAAAQDALEEAILRLSEKAHELAPAQKKLCLAGGVALNCVANQRIITHGGWDEVFILPAPHDSGAALGAAFLAWDEALGGAGKRSTVRLQTAGLGSSISVPVEPQGPWKVRRFSAEQVAALLAEGKAVAWARGRSEFGPRALGSRSLLADPRDPANKEKLNRVIKRRESFRPFAPLVIAERAREVFDLGAHDSPFMLRTVPVHSAWREKIPAAIHVDGTARVQTLIRGANPELYAVLEAFAAKTGVPALLNTSLNTADEPIANDSEHALRIFANTPIDSMVLDDWILEKN